MASVALSPLFNGWQGLGSSLVLLNGGKIFSFLASSSTPSATYTTSTGNIQNANPIILNSDGRPPQEIWLDTTLAYKFSLTDSLGNSLGIYDNIRGIAAAGANTDITSLNFGGSTLSSYVVDTFTGTITGCTTAPTSTVYLTKIGNIVTILVPTFLALTSNATTKTITGMTSAYFPARTQTGIIGVQDNTGAFAAGQIEILTSGVIQLSKDLSSAASGWTNSGQYSNRALSMTYTLA